MNEAQKKSQIANLALIAVLFSITPLLSTSMRTPYLYLLLNLLIIISLLGTQTDLLSFYKPLKNKKPVLVVTPVVEKSSADKLGCSTVTKNNNLPEEITHQNKVKVSSDDQPEKPNPSLFFVGGGGHDDEADQVAETVEDEEDESGGGLSGEELFNKAEMFIGNFYKQLKIQREESWKRIHHGGFYQKAF